MFKEIKILIATGVYPPDIGGPAIYAENLCRELAKMGCQVKVISYGGKEMIEQHKIIIINRHQNILLRYWDYFRQVWRISREVDIVYILDLMSAGLPATLAAKWRNKKVVFRTGGDFLWEKACQKGWTNLPLRKYYDAPKNFREKFLILLCRWILKKIDLIIFSNFLQADIYKKEYGVLEKKITFVPNAMPQIKISSVSAPIENSIVFAGRLVKLKNLERLLKVFNQIKSRKARLLIFGEGPEETNLKYLIRKMRLEGCVKLMGKVSHRELISIINACRFVVIPSLTEISPNIALESISLSKPIVITRETGLPQEIIKELITIDPLSEEDIKNKLEYLLDDNNLSTYTTKLSQLKLVKREWEDVAREHIDIFKNLLNEQNPTY